ncbi:hypothetical protein GCM10027598_61180 [Amycolatopsis oliviviridis]
MKGTFPSSHERKVPFASGLAARRGDRGLGSVPNATFGTPAKASERRRGGREWRMGLLRGKAKVAWPWLPHLPVSECCESHFRNVERCESGFHNTGEPQPPAGPVAKGTFRLCDERKVPFAALASPEHQSVKTIALPPQTDPNRH